MVLKRIFLIYFILFLTSFLLAINANAINPQPLQTEKINLLDNQQLYLKAYANKGKPPELVVTDDKNNIKQIIKFDKKEPDIFSYDSVLYFKVYSIKGLPHPLIMAVAAAPGGSDTLFITKLFTIENGLLKTLNGTGWTTLIEGGIFVGKSPQKTEYGAIVWNFILGNNESHIEPHRYQVDIYQWNGSKFIIVSKLQTKGKYNNGEDALKEFNMHITDMLVNDFPELNQYR